MCGIGCIVVTNYSVSDVSLNHHIDDLILDTCNALRYRGPDSVRHVVIDAGSTRIILITAVLHIRTHQPIIQPIYTSTPTESNNILCFNGEIYQYQSTPLNDATNDTLLLYEQLNRATHQLCHVDTVADRIQSMSDALIGPYSYIYYHQYSGTLYYMRDSMGRRSLCQSISKYNQSDIRVLCSVPLSIPSDTDTNELCCIGLYSTSAHNNVLVDRFHYNQQLVDSNQLIDKHVSSVNEELCDWNPYLRSLNNNNTLQQHNTQSTINQTTVDMFTQHLRDAVSIQCSTIDGSSSDHIGVLFSGGIDCTIIALLVSESISLNQSIDLINVVFVGDLNQSAVRRLVPDRITAIQSYIELQRLQPNRTFNLIQVDLTIDMMIQSRDKILQLIQPYTTVMDFNIGCVLYYAGKASGVIYRNDDTNQSMQSTSATKFVAESGDDDTAQPDVSELHVPPIDRHTRKQLKKDRYNAKQLSKLRPVLSQTIEEQTCISSNDYITQPDVVDQYTSSCRVLFSGLGADEQLAGYGRHRTIWRSSKHNDHSVNAELNKDIGRLWRRNLGRDDRVVSNHGREVRHPFLHEPLMLYLSNLNIDQICDLAMAEGAGDKRLLRLAAQQLGLANAAILPKKAMQFGSRITTTKVAGYASMSNLVPVESIVNQHFMRPARRLGHNSIPAELLKKVAKQQGKIGFE